MEYNTDVFSKVYPLLKDFFYYYLSYKRTHEYLKDLPGNEEFWVYTCDSYLMMATIKWCMVFGTDSNETHWKHIGFSREDFLLRLFTELDINQNTWKVYWENMLSFRNNYIAHKKLGNYEEPVPFFDKAFKAAIVLDNWLREQIKPDIIEARPFCKLVDKYYENIDGTLKDIITANS